MVAQEEEVRKRNEVVKAKHAGALVRYHSKAINGEGVVRIPLTFSSFPKLVIVNSTHDTQIFFILNPRMPHLVFLPCAAD